MAVRWMLIWALIYIKKKEEKSKRKLFPGLIFLAIFRHAAQKSWLQCSYKRLACSFWSLLVLYLRPDQVWSGADQSNHGFLRLHCRCPAITFAFCTPFSSICQNLKTSICNCSSEAQSSTFPVMLAMWEGCVICSLMSSFRLLSANCCKVAGSRAPGTLCEPSHKSIFSIQPNRRVESSRDSLWTELRFDW